MRRSKSAKGSRKRRGGGTAASFAVSSQRNMRPKVKTTRSGQKAGLTLNGGKISGVVEVTPSLQILSSANNVPGNILALIPIHAQTIAPGTRLSDIAAMYDQYVFEKIWFELDCATNYMENGTLLGFVEANATDIIGAVNTQVGNLTEWVDHGSAQIHPIAKGVLTFPRRGDYMKKISRGPKGGMYINSVIPTSGGAALSVMDCFQGQFCLMIHNKINTQGGQVLNYPVDLGALRVHFTLKLREAAERQQDAGAADEHLSSATTPVTNPLGWSGSITEQSTMQIGSTLGFSSRFVSNSYRISLPVGSYFILLWVDYSATGSADWFWMTNTSVQSDLLLIDYGNTSAKLSQASGTSQMAWVECRINSGGEFNIFVSSGTSTGWTLSGYAKCTILAMPSGITTLMKSKDLELRSLAWIDHQKKQDTTSDVLRAVRAELGLEVKKSDTESKLQRKYEVILKERAAVKEAEQRRFAIEEKKHKEEDKWLLDDIEDTPRAFESHRRESHFAAPRLRILQDDEKSDRGKTSREPPRASSLKS